MKVNIDSLKRTYMFKALTALVTCLMFLILPSCQKDELYQDQILKIDLISTTSLTTNSSLAYYGPKTFSRSTGAPFVETVKLENPNFNCFDGNFVLNIQNGSNKKTRVSSAEIWIDGVLVVGASDFSKNVSLITKPLPGLTPESILEVKLNSAPGSFIKIWIEGTIILVAPTFEQIGPLCQNSIAPELPSVSTNVPPISGSWSPENINTSTDGITSYTFTPDEGQCGTAVTIDIEVTPEIESDGDGYTVTQGDCNDNDPNIHPGAAEIPGNDIDEDCNGYVSCFMDVDNDGYGSNSVATNCYPATNGHSLVTNVCGSSNTDGFDDTAFDCNDAVVTINPSATEICDQKDNDCDGEIDEYINIAPVANSGGPYILYSGTNLVINGSQSSDANQPCDYIVSYLWDVDNDGSFDDASGEIVTLTWEQLIAIFGFSPRVGRTYIIKLMVTDRTGISAIVETTLIIYS